VSRASREVILGAVSAAQPESLPLPDLAALGLGVGERPSVAAAVAILDQIGARVLRLRDLNQVRQWVMQAHVEGASVVSAVPGIEGSVRLGELQSPRDLDGVELGVMRARFGVCENGALWLEESDLAFCRALPVIVQRWVVLVGAQDWVADMHEAYARIGQWHSGFGLCLAGPSKTADIEQCLVIGAHGVVEATVLSVDVGLEPLA